LSKESGISNLIFVYIVLQNSKTGLDDISETFEIFLSCFKLFGGKKDRHFWRVVMPILAVNLPTHHCLIHGLLLTYGYHGSHTFPLSFVVTA
jgi:hypothetical protein